MAMAFLRIHGCAPVAHADDRPDGFGIASETPPTNSWSTAPAFKSIFELPPAVKNTNTVHHYTGTYIHGECMNLNDGLLFHDKMWASVEVSSLRQRDALDMVKDVSRRMKVTDTIFGKEFEVRSGAPIFETDPMRAANASAAALDAAKSERLVLSGSRLWISEKDGLGYGSGNVTFAATLSTKPTLSMSIRFW